MEIYDTLPREVRDQIKIAKNNVCAGCIRAALRRFIKMFGSEEDAISWTISQMTTARTYEREKHGRAVVFVQREDLRP